jgi:hypothetical protein
MTHVLLFWVGKGKKNPGKGKTNSIYEKYSFFILPL